MFEHLEPFSKIIVTGPQRSGTTIVARAIEHDLGRQYVDERAFSAIDYYKFMILVAKLRGFVMQAPGMCRFVHMLAEDEHVAVVLVRRSIEDIIASQKRIGWDWEEFEKIRYDLADLDMPISVIKYCFWDEAQADLIPNSFEVEYESMRSHPLWLDKADRADFDKRQHAAVPV